MTDKSETQPYYRDTGERLRRVASNPQPGEYAIDPKTGMVITHPDDDRRGWIGRRE